MLDIDELLIPNIVDGSFFFYIKEMQHHWQNCELLEFNLYN